MDLGLINRLALGLGASSGIGRGVAVALAGEGARVALASRSAERLAPAAEEIGDAATPFAADTDDPDRMATLVSEVEAALGR